MNAEKRFEELDKQSSVISKQIRDIFDAAESSHSWCDRESHGDCDISFPFEDVAILQKQSDAITRELMNILPPTKAKTRLKKEIYRRRENMMKHFPDNVRQWIDDIE